MIRFTKSMLKSGDRVELRSALIAAEQSYKKAETSLDNSLEYIVRKEELK